MSALESPPPRLVHELCATFHEQVRRALAWELDGTPASLAIVDHYLASAREEDREPILSLLAAGAGAYFGELVCQHVGAIWLGDGKDPWRLQVLLRPQFVYFSPVSMAFEAILGESPKASDTRLAAGADFAPEFRLPPGRIAGIRKNDDDDEDDAGWLASRLDELPPLTSDQYFSLTGRFETLQTILEFLAERHMSLGYGPREYSLVDYVDALT